MKQIQDIVRAQDVNKFASDPFVTAGWLFPLLDTLGPVKVLDMTAYIGSESLVAALHPNVKSVDSYEINPDTYKLLVKNTQNQPKIKTHNSSSLKVRGKYDLVLCDPPFGGTDYAGDKAAYRRFKEAIDRGKPLDYTGISNVDLKMNTEPQGSNEPLKIHGKVFVLKMPFNCQYSPWWKDTSWQGRDSITIGIRRGPYLTYAVRIFTKNEAVLNRMKDLAQTEKLPWCETFLTKQKMIIGGKRLPNILPGRSAIPDQIKQWQHFIKLDGEDNTVLDMTAGIGGHAIHFAYRKFIKSVIAYEKDSSTAQLLRKNIAAMDSFVADKIEVREQSSANEKGQFNLIICSPDIDRSATTEEDKKKYGAFARAIFQFVTGRESTKPECPFEPVDQTLDGTPILDFVKTMKYDVFAYEMSICDRLSPYIRSPVKEKDIGVDNITVSIFNKGKVDHLVRLFFKNKEMFKWAKEKQDMGKLKKTTTTKKPVEGGRKKKTQSRSRVKRCLLEKK